MDRFALVMLACTLAGCGFHRDSSGDGGAPAADLAAGGVNADVPGAPADLAGSSDAVDLAVGDGSVGGGGTGPGPLGALPTGFCCSSNDDCRSRVCAGLMQPVHYCVDECDHDSLCSAWGGNFKCDLTGTGYCMPAGTTTSCLDPSLYPYGARPIGSCCQSGFDKSGQECLGGLCESVGPEANPFYCTQGCDAATPCPAPYVCNSVGFCSLPDPNATYSCR